MHIQLVCIVKFKFLARFPVDPLSHPVVSTLYVVALICCIHLLCEWSLHLYHRLTYIFYFVVICLVLLWYSRSLWLCFLLLSEEIQFLSNVSLSLAMSMFSGVRFRFFVAWNVHRVVFLPSFAFCFLGFFCLFVLSVLFPMTVISLLPHLFM